MIPLPTLIHRPSWRPYAPVALDGNFQQKRSPNDNTGGGPVNKSVDSMKTIPTSPLRTICPVCAPTKHDKQTKSKL